VEEAEENVTGQLMCLTYAGIKYSGRFEQSVLATADDMHPLSVINHRFLISDFFRPCTVN